MFKKIKKSINLNIIFAIVIITFITVLSINANNSSENSLAIDANATTSSTINEPEHEETTFPITEAHTTPDSAQTTKDINLDAELPYLIKVNRVMNCVTVYGIDSSNNYSIPYKSFICSVGDPIDYTPLGTFAISDKYDWRLMIDNSYAQFAVRITGQILFHSVGYYSRSNDDLKYTEYNKLGTNASLGCIRLTCEDSKWIYDNCSPGTTVIIYDDENSPGPLGKPTAFQIPEDNPNKKWDPTDSDQNNPWK